MTITLRKAYAEGRDTAQGVDCSYDRLTPEEARRLKQSGVEVFWQCLWTGKETPKCAQHNIEVAFAAGFKWVGAYISLNGDPRIIGGQHVRAGLSALPRETWDMLHFVAVDVELPGITQSQVIHAIDALEVLGKSVARGEAVVYTSYNAWTNYVREKSELFPLARRGVLLVNAFWDKHPDVDFSRFQYGGWTTDQVLAEQWSGGYLHPSGQYLDRNTFMTRLLKRGDEMREIEELEKRVEVLENRAAVAKLGEQLAWFALQGMPLPTKTREEIQYVLALAEKGA